MDPQDFLGFQAPLEKMDYLVFQAPKDPRGGLASLVFQVREEGWAQMDNLEEREKLGRKAGLVFRET